MLQPKRSKYRKQFKGRIHGKATSANKLDYGEFGLKALEPDRVTARQIEAARRAITRAMKRQVSKKPAEVRMGAGKGAPEFWACRVKPGRVLFEVDGVNTATAKEALGLAAAKLPIKTKFIARLGHTE